MVWIEKITRMKLLTVDIGTGTQDIYLFDSRVEIENGYKMILPSPTLRVRRELNQAGRKGSDVLLTGSLMGGGPSGWGVADHLKRGLKVYATPEAAQSLDDDLEAVRASGVIVVSADEANTIPDSIERIHMRDFDFSAIQKAFSAFGITLQDLNAVAIAVFDHGNAPVGVSDRKFRFNYLAQRICAENRLSAFAYRSENIPEIMTRLRSAANSAAGIDAPVVVMDTAPAAILGATLDPVTLQHERQLIVNLGNMHILGFRLGPTGIEGAFEDHSHHFDRPQLESQLLEFAVGSLTNEKVFRNHGHGAWINSTTPLPMDHPDHNLVVIGPRRGLLAGSSLRPYFAVPYGDMMIAGCFGLLRACADLLPECREPILSALNGTNSPHAAWEYDG
jgi:uncharacterized protein (DUF1786 family)